MGENRRPLGNVPPAPKQIEKCSSQNNVPHLGQSQGNKVKVGGQSDSEVDSTFGKDHGMSCTLLGKYLGQNVHHFASASCDRAGSEAFGTRSAAASCMAPPSSVSALNSKDLYVHDFHTLGSNVESGDYPKISGYPHNLKGKMRRDVSKRKERSQGSMRYGHGNSVPSMSWSAPSMVECYDFDTTNNLSTFDVVARIRPLNDLEISSGAEECMDIVQQGQDGDLLRVFRKSSRERQPQEKEMYPLVQNNFSFRSCITPDEGQDVVFDKCGLPQLIEDALDGINVTIFAVRLLYALPRVIGDIDEFHPVISLFIVQYGQTGSGKTFTIHGSQPRDDVGLSTKGSGCNGIIPNSLRYLFDKIDAANDCGPAVSCGASYLEIYNEGIYDLLISMGNSPLRLKWAAGEGFCVPDLHIQPCNTLEDAKAVLSLGNRRRRQRSHLLNTSSSRSHTILTLYLHRTMQESGTYRSGKIHFVDLAGSEKLKETCSESLTATKETTNINKSLFLLGKVICALASGQSRNLIPYRESKLTKLLFGSMVSPSKCLMIACCSPRCVFQKLLSPHFLLF